MYEAPARAASRDFTAPRFEPLRRRVAARLDQAEPPHLGRRTRGRWVYPAEGECRRFARNRDAVARSAARSLSGTANRKDAKQWRAARLGDDAKQYQIRAMRTAIAEVEK